MTRDVDVDLFAGAGGWDTGLAALGVPSPLGIEHDRDAVATARAAGHLRLDHDQADVAELDPHAVTGHRPVRLLTASPPCFPGGTPVVTARGVMAIEEVRVGDVVLTHRNRWRPVTATMSRTAPVYADGWLAATADHPFWTRRQIRTYDSKARRSHWHLAEPGWTPAAAMHGRFVGIPESPDALPIPPIPGRPVETDAAFWYMIGRWLGDGWIRLVDPDPAPPKARTSYSPVPRDCENCDAPAAKHARYTHLWTAYCGRTCNAAAARARRTVPRSEILICCATDEADALASKLADTGMTWTRSQERTTTRFSASHNGLSRWLVEHFGRYAHGKTLPGWVLGAAGDVRGGILDGYLAADGSVAGRGWSATTVSANLAVGMRIVATTLGYVTNLTRNRPRTNNQIEGRTVSERPFWQLRMTPDEGRYTRSDGSHRWSKRRRPMTHRGNETVYDLTVTEDHSFVAHGFVVHNCQAWSKAGKRGGIKDQPRIWGHLGAVREAGRWIDYPRDGWHDNRSPLVLELIRWVDALRPQVIAAEQVPDVLPFWEEVCRWLRTLGYSATCGELSAERYGVPQTRKRAILVARRGGRRARLPAPTHARYVAPRGSGIQADGLFDAPDPQRIVPPTDRHLLPWVSMADALGWDPAVRMEMQRGRGMAERHGERPDRSAAEPSFTITAGVKGSGPRLLLRQSARSNATERTADGSYSTGWTLHTSSGYEGRETTRDHDQPAPTFTGESRSGWYMRTWIERDGAAPAPTLTTSMDGWTLRTGNNSMVTGRTGSRADDGDVRRYECDPTKRPAPTLDTNIGSKWTLRQSARSNATERTADEPAPTILCSRTTNLSWHLRNGNQGNACTRAIDEPAGTLFFGGRVNAVDSVTDRPATTVQGDPRVAGPGHRDREGGQRQFDADHIRITVEQAGVLQSFPADYPWQGTRSAQFRQVGDAVPPLLAAAVLGELLDIRPAAAT